jgi:asparagine synthase (glutamine-hydrolysing)
MSGFVGIVRFDGVPVDAALLGRMTAALRYRGPDAQSTWIDGAVGFGHALLVTTADSRLDQPPLTLGGNAWIVADARLDGRRDLVASLRAHGRCGVEEAGDAALVLHAYHVWHDRCVEHLRGDFAFAIWDHSTRRLFAARDHFGVKPLYYARIDGGLVLGNTLGCLRMHPHVSDRLNDSAIADFLLFGLNQDPSSTVFADIRKVEPATSLACSELPPSGVITRRYWELPAGGRVRYRQSQEYVDHFNDLLQQAVADRLRTDAAGIWMSGGLDSTAIAAVARRVMSGAARLSAQTVVYDSLIPDDERSYAEDAARALGLAVDFVIGDSHTPLAGWERPELAPPEPIDEPFLQMRNDLLRRAASHARVWLGGDGGDELLRQSYVIDLLGRMPVVEFGSDLLWTLARHRCRPGFGLRARMHGWIGRHRAVPEFPAWIDPAFAARFDLKSRWQHVLSAEPVGHHVLRPEAQGRLAMGQWASSFEAYDPGATRVEVEYRTPFLDLRLIEYALAIPPLPWCVDKHLLRTAMNGLMPDSVRLRPKSPLADDPVGAHLGKAPLPERAIDLTGELGQYVETDTLRQHLNERSGDPWLHLRPLCLSHWLRHMRARRGVP